LVSGSAHFASDAALGFAIRYSCRVKRALVVTALLAVACSNKDAAAPVDSGAEVGDEIDLPPVCKALVDKGPWVLAVDSTSAKVRWEACVPGPGGIRYSREAGGAETKAASKVSETVVTETIEVPFLRDADFAGTYYMHEVALTGLEAGTCYVYTLDTDATAKGRFCTARAAGTPFSFVSIGDTNPGFAPTSDLLEQIYPKNPDFTIHGGDIQYYASGLETYTFWFGKMQRMLRTGAFFPAIGNHESEKPTERVEYVDRFFGGAGFDGTKDYYRHTSGGVWFFAVDSEIDASPGSEQGKWLLAGLEYASKQPGFRFSVVYRHGPLATCGDVSEPEAVRQAYQPSFEKFGAKIVIGAHLHCYERFEIGEVTYITTGGGGGALMNPNANLSRASCALRKASGAYFHAVLFEVKATEVTGTVIDYHGNVRDTFSRTIP